MRKTNKKGKPVGKPMIVGFALEYSTAMDPATAGLAANYQVDATARKHGKGKWGPGSSRSPSLLPTMRRRTR